MLVRRFSLTLALGILIAAPGASAGRGQSTTTFRATYMTFNLAGASEKYAGGAGRPPEVHATHRRRAVSTLLHYIDLLHPQGVAVQELCSSTAQGVDDAYDYRDGVVDDCGPCGRARDHRSHLRRRPAGASDRGGGTR